MTNKNEILFDENGDEYVHELTMHDLKLCREHESLTKDNENLRIIKVELSRNLRKFGIVKTTRDLIIDSFPKVKHFLL